MQVKVIVTKLIQVTKDIICDICGNSCMIGGDFVSMKLFAAWGYESQHDLEVWSADVCEACVITKLAPIVKFNKGERLPF